MISVWSQDLNFVTASSIEPSNLIETLHCANKVNMTPANRCSSSPNGRRFSGEDVPTPLILQAAEAILTEVTRK